MLLMFPTGHSLCFLSPGFLLWQRGLTGVGSGRVWCWPWLGVGVARSRAAAGPCCNRAFWDAPPAPRGPTGCGGWGGGRCTSAAARGRGAALGAAAMASRGRRPWSPVVLRVGPPAVRRGRWGPWAEGWEGLCLLCHPLPPLVAPTLVFLCMIYFISDCELPPHPLKHFHHCHVLVDLLHFLLIIL